jgi:hypothetical protein
MIHAGQANERCCDERLDHNANGQRSDREPYFPASDDEPEVSGLAVSMRRKTTDEHR